MAGESVSCVVVGMAAWILITRIAECCYVLIRTIKIRAPPTNVTLRKVDTGKMKKL